MILRSFHRTVYGYSTPSAESHNEVRLEPVSDSSQRRLSFSLSTAPAANIFSFNEIGGTVHYFTLRSPHQSLEILAKAEVETFRSNPFEDLNLVIPDLEYYRTDMVKHEFAEFLVPSTYVSESGELQEMANAALQKANGVAVHFLLTLNQILYDLLTYDPDVTHVHSTVDEVIALGAGVCQDFAHVMIGCCRSIGIPARYVSGYLHSSQGSGIRGSEAMHAWIEAPIPGGSWLALDPTNNLLANDHHIKVHTGRDYADISPLSGLYLGRQAESLEVEIRVDEVDPADFVQQGIA